MRIGVIDDDETILAFVQDLLIGRGYFCITFLSGRDLLSALARETFDLLVLDWNLPEMDGLDIVRWINANLTPTPAILMLTSRNDSADIVAALEAGADDYVVKPETAAVIAARIEAILRRSARRKDSEGETCFGRYVFDTRTNQVRLDDHTITLTPKEFALALRFFRRRDHPLSRASLFEAVWRSVAPLSTRTLDMHVSRLRTKLQLEPQNGFCLQTIFGYGYRLETCSSVPAEPALS